MIPLDFDLMMKSLGPGYKNGWYTFDQLGNRIDNCVIQERTFNKTSLAKVMAENEEVKINVKSYKDYEEFAHFLETTYHRSGHELIADACSDMGPDKNGGMKYSEVSARDPLFWRYHLYLEQLIQENKALNHPR